MTRVRIIMGLIGVVVLTLMVRSIGPEQLVASMAKLGWAVPALLLVGLVKNMLRALAWRMVLKAEGTTIPAMALFQARVASQSIALFASMGSAVADPVKSWLVRRHAPVEKTLAPTVVEALTYWFTSLLTVALGLGSALLLRGGQWTAPGIAALAGIVTGLSWLFWTRRSLLAPLSLALERRSGPNGRVASILRRAVAVEQSTRAIRARQSFTLFGIASLSLCVQALTTAEVAIVLAQLGAWPGWFGVLLVDGISRASKATSFFIPGRIGVDEAASAAGLLLVGLPAAIGLTLALARRVSGLAWAGLGLLWLRFDGPAFPAASANEILKEMKS